MWDKLLKLFEQTATDLFQKYKETGFWGIDLGVQDSVLVKLKNSQINAVITYHFSQQQELQAITLSPGRNGLYPKLSYSLVDGLRLKSDLDGRIICHCVNDNVYYSKVWKQPQLEQFGLNIAVEKLQEFIDKSITDFVQLTQEALES
tara:strand:+ start:165 stop:605 length:441 start_codon:yes stop_codon:yes gene_type:complete